MIEQARSDVASEQQHRQETRWQILLPLLLGLFLIVICTILVILFRKADQVSLVADTMVVVFMLCPMTICLLPITLGLIVGAFAMNKVHDQTRKPLRRLQLLSRQMADQTQKTTDTINQKTINTSARMGALYRLLDVFNRPRPSKSEVKDE